MMRKHAVFGRGAGGGALALAALVGLVGACSDAETSTALAPEGPAKVLQVFAQERVEVMNDDGSFSFRTRNQLAYGDHPDIAPEDDDRVVTNAIAKDTQKFRVVVDELLDGSSLEQVACADGTFSDIPTGTTPDDVKDCTGELSKCTKVCVGAQGPIGVLDEDEDGAADDFRFREGSVRVECGGANMELDLEKSFYNPSGNQLIPADPDLGLNGLGPAVVLVPLGLRTGSSCTIVFDSSVTDKEGNQVCAPMPCATAGCDVQAQPCTPGDTSAIDFGVQPFLVLGTDPQDGADDVPPAGGEILIQFNALLDEDSLTAIVIDDGGGPVTVEYEVDMDDRTITVITVPGGFAPNTEYTVTVTSGQSGIKDAFGGVLAEDYVFTFTTGSGPAPTPDAGPGDPDAAAPAPDAGAPSPDAAA